MARAMWERNTRLYRAVLRSPSGEFYGAYGPYDTVGQARAAATRETQSPYRQSLGLTAGVEATVAEWGPLDPPLHTFTEWPKTTRLMRDIVVTEKIDGSNAAVVVRALSPTQYCPTNAKYTMVGDVHYAVFAQSRKRIITPGKTTDNYGFAAWVWGNATELASLLGPGLHYGEWWGAGIQRGYGFANGERRFSLFNTDRYPEPNESVDVGGVPVCAVPRLYQGLNSTDAVREALMDLKTIGSYAAPGFTNPEGVCVYHTASRTVSKVTLDNQDRGKWEGEAAWATR